MKLGFSSLQISWLGTQNSSDSTHLPRQQQQASKISLSITKCSIFRSLFNARARSIFSLNRWSYLFDLWKCCREFNQNSNLWETKQIEKRHVKENNHMHKTIFTWFGNLPTSTELQGFHYKIRRYNSAQEHSQETQFPIHHNSLSPTRQENTILSSYAAARLLGIFL